MFKCPGFVLLCAFWGACSSFRMMRLSASVWGSDTPQSFVCAQQELLLCQSLPKNLLFQLLGLSIATLSTVTHYGLHFTLLSNISLETNSYRVIHHAGRLRSHPSETFGEPRSCKSPRAVKGNAEASQKGAGAGFWRTH